MNSDYRLSFFIKKHVGTGTVCLFFSLYCPQLLAVSAPFSETFDSYQVTEFTHAGTSGAYRLEAQAPSGYAYRATLASTTGHTTASSGVQIDNVAGTAFSVATELEISSLAAPNSASVNAGLGLFSNTTDFSTGSQYRLLYQLSSGNAGKLVLLRNGVTVARSAAILPPRLNQTYTLRAHVSHSSGSIRIKGQLSDDSNTIALSATDDAPLPGIFFGFRTALAPSGAMTNVTVNYDNFSVTPASSDSGGETSPTGSLSVAGTLDVGGNAITFGSSNGTYAAGLLYEDTAGGDLVFDLTSPAARWSWQHGGRLGMALDAQGRLSLFSATGVSTEVLRLDPAGTSEFGSVKVRESLTVGGELRIAPRGDLSMGEFTQGIAPSP